MAIIVVGSGNQTYAAEYLAKEDAIFKTYSYKDGKGEETVYHLKDCLQLSLDSYNIPVGSDTYEAIKNQLKPQASGYMSLPNNKLFYETYDIMTDFYSGKIGRDEVKNIFKEYFYHSGGKSFAADRLAGLYEYFSRANTRCACAQNEKEGKALLESRGLSWKGSYYYNADWYWACEEMQALFRETANELADEYGVEHVDFEAVEKNTKFKIDGGITFNGVWSSRVWQINGIGDASGNLLNINEAPPKGFLYCNCPISDSEQERRNMETNRESLESVVKDLDKKKNHTNLLFLMAIGDTDNRAGSLLLQKNDKLYQDAIGFLKNFNLRYYGNSRMEFLKMRAFFTQI